MKKNLIILFCAVTSLAAGCTMAPKYSRPELPVPGQWPESVPAAATLAQTADADIPWQEFFRDENLQNLIEIALNNNRDLKLAALNTERAQALYGIQRATLLPSLYASGGGAKEHTPADLSYTGTQVTSEQYNVSLGITDWEVDFFGRVRSLKDQALEEYLATEEALRGARLSIITSVAQAYLSLIADRESLQLLQATLDAQQKSYNLIKRRYEVGLATELDLSRAQTPVDSARRDIAVYTQQVARDLNALSLLLGASLPQNNLPDKLGDVKDMRPISAGLSSEILFNRPDILQAEHHLKGAYANIGAARAAFFPRIALTTAYGTASSELSGLFEAGSKAWSFAPQFSLPIFDPRVFSAYRISKIDREIVLANYEKAIQSAFSETSDALAVLATVDDQIAAQESLNAALSTTYRLAEIRYTKGIDNYLSVLDAQRSLYDADLALVHLRLAKRAAQVNLYAVLGGDALQSGDGRKTKE